MNFDLIISLIHNPEKETNFTQQCSPDYVSEKNIFYYANNLI